MLKIKDNYQINGKNFSKRLEKQKLLEYLENYSAYYFKVYHCHLALSLEVAQNSN